MKHLRSASLVSVIFASAILALGCSQPTDSSSNNGTTLTYKVSDFVGNWVTATNGDTYQFKDDGTGSMYDSVDNQTWALTWKLTTDTVDKLDASGNPIIGTDGQAETEIASVIQATDDTYNASWNIRIIEANTTLSLEDLTTSEIYTLEGSSSTGTVSATGVTLNHSSVALIVGGGSYTLTASVAPADATDQTVSWTSSATSIVNIASSTGSQITLSPVAPGTATITCTTEDGGYTATCTINVSAATSSLAAPTGVSADAYMSSAYGLCSIETWKWVTGASGYEIWRSTSSSSYGTKIASTSSSVNIYEDFTVNSSTTYYYYIRAIDSNGAGGAYSTSAYVYTGAYTTVY